jgi:hypothetical protein
MLAQSFHELWQLFNDRLALEFIAQRSQYDADPAA